MANGLGRKSLKRKQEDEEDGAFEQELRPNGTLEMLSDEEDDEDVSSDDGQLDAFPEIVDESDTDESEEDEGEEEEEDEKSEDEDEDESEAESDDSLHVFPKAKTVVSDITKQPKVVYPEIEPEYDSDSSTEEVSELILLFCTTSKVMQGPQ